MLTVSNLSFYEIVRAASLIRENGLVEIGLRKCSSLGMYNFGLQYICIGLNQWSSKSIGDIRLGSVPTLITILACHACFLEL